MTPRKSNKTKKSDKDKKESTAKPKAKKRPAGSQAKKSKSPSRSKKKTAPVEEVKKKEFRPGPIVVAPPKKTEAPKVEEKPVLKTTTPEEVEPAKKKASPPPPPPPPVEAPKTEVPAPKQKPKAPPKPQTTVFPRQPSPAHKKEPPRPPQRFSGIRKSSSPAPASSPQKEPATAGSENGTATRQKITFNEMMTVKDLSDAMNIKVTEVIKKLLLSGTPATINQRLESDVASLLADGFGFDLEIKSIYSEEVEETPEDKAKLKPRPPVVTVMGHVDHGKTSLLDAIKSSRVASNEAGGITQHIGAYQVKTDHGSVTFLDTPGHEAFTAMRARGATATDIVILVVAADDSVMPQTVEAIDHAKAAGVPIVVAINKCDLPQGNPNKVRQELANYELVSEDWGGKTIMVEVSAKTNQNIDKLLEMLLLEAEILELKANPDRPAKGVVLEAKMDPRRGVTTTLLVQSGTLRVGDVIVCGLSYGRVRALSDETRVPMEKAGPSIPAEILGLNKVPEAGDQFSCVTNEREAREISERRQERVKTSTKTSGAHISLETLHTKIEEGKIQDLPVIIKADVQGSLQALEDSLGRLSTSAVQVRFVHTAVGNINESDVLLGEASDAIVFGFNVKNEPSAEAEAKRAGVDIRSYRIIYEMMADVRAAMEGLLKPEEREAVRGRAEVKQAFNSSRYGKVAGVMVLEGTLTRGHKARVMREGNEVGKGSINSLRRFKDDVREVEKGYECGLSMEGLRNFQPGDIIEDIVIEKHARRLDA